MQIDAKLVDENGALLKKWTSAPHSTLEADKVEIDGVVYQIEKVVLTDDGGPIYRIETKKWSEPEVDWGEALSFGFTLALLFWVSFWLLFTNPDILLGIVVWYLELILIGVGVLLLNASLKLKSRYKITFALAFTATFLVGAYYVFKQIVFNDPTFSIPEEMTFEEIGRLVRTNSESIVAFFWSLAPWIGIAVATLGSKIISGTWGAFYKLKPKKE